MNGSAADDSLLPYVEVTDDTFATAAAAAFTVEEPYPGILVLRGPCPRCQAIIDVPLVDKVFRATRSLRDIRCRRRQTSAASNVEPMICTCEDDHPNRPDDRFGCGAYWNIEIPARRP